MLSLTAQQSYKYFCFYTTFRCYKILVWLPPIITSIITGPIATCFFHLEMNGAAVNSGMGTCGLCGPIGVWTGWTDPTAFDWCGLALVSIVLPALICPLIGLLFRKAGWIRPGDLTI